MENSKSTIPCYVVKDLLPNYIDNLLSDETAKSVSEHLLSCSDCSSALETMKQPLRLSEENKGDGFSDDGLKVIKRIRTKMWMRILMVAILVILTTATLGYLLTNKIYAIPMDDIEISEKYELSDGSIYIRVVLDERYSSRSIVVDVGATVYVNDYGAEDATYDFYLGYKVLDFSSATKSKDHTVLHLLVYSKEITSENYEEVTVQGWGADDSVILWTMGEELQKAPIELENEVFNIKGTDFWMTSK